MTFPFNYRGFIAETVPGKPRWALDVLRAILFKGLWDKGARNIDNTPDTVLFDGKGFEFVSWDAFAYVSSGKISINHHDNRLEIAYQLHFVVLTMFTILIGCLLALGFLLQIPWGFLCIIGLWLLSVVFLYWSSIVLFRRFLKNCLKEFIEYTTTSRNDSSNLRTSKASTGS